MSSSEPKPSADVPAAAPAEDLTTARRTLRQWLQALEKAAVLKPGATKRILTGPKIARLIIPKA